MRNAAALSLSTTISRSRQPEKINPWVGARCGLDCNPQRSVTAHHQRRQIGVTGPGLEQRHHTLFRREPAREERVSSSTGPGPWVLREKVRPHNDPLGVESGVDVLPPRVARQDREQVS